MTNRASVKMIVRLGLPANTIYIEVAPGPRVVRPTLASAQCAILHDPEHCVLATQIHSETGMPVAIFRRAGYVATLINGQTYLTKYDVRNAARETVDAWDKDHNAITRCVTLYPVPYSHTTAGKNAGRGKGTLVVPARTKKNNPPKRDQRLLGFKSNCE